VWRKVVIDTKQKFKESRDARAQLETELEGMRAQLTQAAQTNGNSSKNIDELQQKIATTERQMEAHKTNAKKLYLEVVC
jgi:phage shock protein A